MDSGSKSCRAFGTLFRSSNSVLSAKKNISLHIHLLPSSPGVPDKITFPTIADATTVGELKKKIQENVSTNPSPERQRVIYRGHSLNRDELSLRDVFGREEVDQDNTPQNRYTNSFTRFKMLRQ